jgi:hypothetical protein
MPSSAEREQTRLFAEALVRDEDLLNYSTALPTPQPSTVPVYKADDGSLFAPHPDNPALGMVPYAPGPEITYDEASRGASGFLPATQMSALAKSMPANQGAGLPMHQLLAAHALHGAAAAGQEQLDGAKPQSVVKPEKEGQQGTEGSLPPGASPPHAPRPLLSSFEMGLAQRALPVALAGMLRGNLAGGLGGAFGSAFSISGIGFGFASQYVGAQVQAAFQKAWPIDDTSSTGEWVAHTAAQKMIEKLQGMMMDWVASQIGLGNPNAPSMLKQIKSFFTLAESSAHLGAASLGTLDDKGNVVTTANVHQVLVNNMVAAVGLEGVDLLTPAGKPILDGSTTVFIGEGLFSRATAATAVPSLLTPPNTSTDVFVGGDGLPPSLIQALQSNPMSIPPNQVLQAAAAINAHDKLLPNQPVSQEQAEAFLDAEKPNPQRAEDVLNATYKDKRAFYEDIMANGGEVPRIVKDSQGNYVVEPGDTGLVLRETFPSLSQLPDDLQAGGFLAFVFEDKNTGQLYLAYRGSDDIVAHFQEDWLFTNFAEGFGLVPSQYSQAVAVAQQVLGNPDYAGQPLLLMGHSLGGGLSSYAAGMLGLPSFNLNSAGLGPGLMNNLINQGVPVVPGQIQHYNTSNDFLSHIINPMTFGQYGDSYEVPGFGPAIFSGNPFYGHGTNAFYGTNQSGQLIIPADWPPTLAVTPYSPPLPGDVIPPYF